MKKEGGRVAEAEEEEEEEESSGNPLRALLSSTYVGISRHVFPTFEASHPLAIICFPACWKLKLRPSTNEATDDLKMGMTIEPSLVFFNLQATVFTFLSKSHISLALRPMTFLMTILHLDLRSSASLPLPCLSSANQVCLVISKHWKSLELTLYAVFLRLPTLIRVFFFFFLPKNNQSSA
jgi:hypothetical protein